MKKVCVNVQSRAVFLSFDGFAVAQASLKGAQKVSTLMLRGETLIKGRVDFRDEGLARKRIVYSMRVPLLVAASSLSRASFSASLSSAVWPFSPLILSRQSAVFMIVF